MSAMGCAGREAPRLARARAVPRELCLGSCGRDAGGRGREEQARPRGSQNNDQTPKVEGWSLK